MTTIRDWIELNVGFSADFQGRFFTSIAVILGLWVVRYLAQRLVEANIDDTSARFNWRKGIGYAVSILGIFLVGRIWLDGIQSLATYFGLLSAGLAIALQAPIVDFFGWFYIIWQRPFSIGDRIQLGDNAGDVIDTDFFNITLLEIGNWVDAEHSTGRILHIPNKHIFNEPLANYNQGIPFLWNEISVLITFESDWKKAKQILTDIVSEKAPKLTAKDLKSLRQGTNRYAIKFGKTTPIVYTDVEANGVELTLRYLVPPRQRRGSKQAIWEAILEGFKENSDIELAYNTQRIYFPDGEQKDVRR